MTAQTAEQRQPITKRLASFHRNVAQSIEMVGIAVGAHGLTKQQKQLEAIAKVLRDRKTQ